MFTSLENVNNVNMGIQKIMCVTGILTFRVGAEVINTPLNHSVFFVKDKNVILTSDYWRIVVNFDLTAYQDETSILREDLSRIEDTDKRTFPTGELRHVRATLDSLEMLYIALYILLF